jgi:hypothetical protein
MAILLFQERPTAWRRRASQGDGGVDVAEPNLFGYHVSQIKGFTGSMTPSRRRQVEDSFTQIETDPRLEGPVTGWSLIVPMDPTSQDEKWFRELTTGASFPCDWKGQLFWDSEAAKHSSLTTISETARVGWNKRSVTFSSFSPSPGHPCVLSTLLGSLRFSDPR